MPRFRDIPHVNLLQRRTRKRLYQTAKALTGLGARTVATAPFLRDVGLADPVVDGPRRTTTLLVSSYGQNTISGELARSSVPISFPRKETWMEDAASRIAEWIEWGGGLGQYEWVLWAATNKLEWEYPADIKTLTIPMRRSRGGPPSGPPPLDPQVEKAVEDLRLLEGPKAIWARAAAAARHLVAKGLRAHERRHKNCPQALVRYETLALGNTSRWLWRHDWTMTLPTALVTALLRMRLDVFPVMQKLKDWRKMDRGTCLLCDSGREETLAHFLVDCDGLANTREVTTLIPSHSTLDINVTPGHIPANTVAEVFTRIREERLSSEEMSQVLIGGTVAKEEEGTERVVTWETLVPPELAPEAAADPRNGSRPPRHPLWVHAWFGWIYAIVKIRYRLVGRVLAGRAGGGQ